MHNHVARGFFSKWDFFLKKRLNERIDAPAQGGNGWARRCERPPMRPSEPDDVFAEAFRCAIQPDSKK